MLINRPEFHIADLAVVTAGGTPFSIYQTYTADQIRYVIEDSGAKVIITEQAYLPVVQEACEELPGIEHVILIDPPAEGAPEGTIALADVEGSNPDFDAEAAVAAMSPEDVLTLIYTSGTTGPPKGVELAHRNLITAVSGIEEIVSFPPGSRVVSWLPGRAHRRARGPPLPADRLRLLDHDLRGPASGDGGAARRAPAVVLRRAAHLGEAEGRPRDDDRRPARRAACGDRARALRRRREGAPRAGRGGGSRRAGRGRRRRRRRVLRQVARDGRPRRGAGDQRRRRADAGRGAGVLPRDRPAARRAVGDVGDVRRRHGQPAGRDPYRHRRPARAELRGHARRRRRGPDPRRHRDARLPQQARADCGHDRRRRLAAHRRHRRLRRGRLPEDRRPQEGDHHQRGRQEHVAGEHRGARQVGSPADRPGLLHRRRTALQHRAGRARRRLRSDVGVAAGDRGHLARRAGARTSA